MRIKQTPPILWTKNLRETISFYENVLGFTGHCDFPNFVSLLRDNAEIMFIVPDAEDADEKEKFSSNATLPGSIYFFMENVDEFWEAVKDKATVKTAICDREYLMRDFSILDNNGYELVFGQEIS